MTADGFPLLVWARGSRYIIHVIVLSDSRTSAPYLVSDEGGLQRGARGEINRHQRRRSVGRASPRKGRAEGRDESGDGVLAQYLSTGWTPLIRDVVVDVVLHVQSVHGRTTSCRLIDNPARPTLKPPASQTEQSPAPFSPSPSRFFSAHRASRCLPGTLSCLRSSAPMTRRFYGA